MLMRMLSTFMASSEPAGLPLAASDASLSLSNALAIASAVRRPDDMPGVFARLRSASTSAKQLLKKSDAPNFSESRNQPYRKLLLVTLMLQRAGRLSVP